MGRRSNLAVGQKINTFTVTESLPSKHGHSIWRVRCDCGSEREMRGTDFRTAQCACQMPKSADIVEQLKAEVLQLRKDHQMLRHDHLLLQVEVNNLKFDALARDSRISPENLDRHQQYVIRQSREALAEVNRIANQRYPEN